MVQGWITVVARVVIAEDADDSDGVVVAGSGDARRMRRERSVDGVDDPRLDVEIPEELLPGFRVFGLGSMVEA